MGLCRKEKEKRLKQLWQLYRAGRIDLFFGDESGFSMKPSLPYGWMKGMDRVEIFPQRDKKINLFGVFRPDNFCITYESDRSINSEFVIKAINDVCQYLNKKRPTVLVLDNASIHRSEDFLRKVNEWIKKGLYIFFLPKYSPHLNKAEIYWRKAKYEWLRPKDYYSFSRYKKKVREIFNKVGIDYKIEFAEMLT